MAHDGHHHDEHDEHGSELSPIALRVKALESLLVEKGYVDPAALDVLIETYETKIGPRNGARVVAKAWTDPAYADWLKRGRHGGHRVPRLSGRQGEHMVACSTTSPRTTWSSARSAPAYPCRCWACRPSGTGHALSGRVPSSSRARC